MTPRLLDTNFIIRHLVRDNVEHAEVAGQFFQAVDRGEATGVILAAVLAECVFVLQSNYRISRPSIAAQITALLTVPNIKTESQTVCLEALRLYASTKFHFIDCLIAATAVAEDCPVATFDSDFFRFAGVRVDVG